MLSYFQRDARVNSEVPRSSLLEVDKAVSSHQDGEPRLAGMRTIAVVLLADPDQAQWLHIGHSRLYHFRVGRVGF